MPLWVKPARKVRPAHYSLLLTTLLQVTLNAVLLTTLLLLPQVTLNGTFWAMRSHFEGTFFDMGSDVGGGPLTFDPTLALTLSPTLTLTLIPTLTSHLSPHP